MIKPASPSTGLDRSARNTISLVDLEPKRDCAFFSTSENITGYLQTSAALGGSLHGFPGLLIVYGFLDFNDKVKG